MTLLNGNGKSTRKYDLIWIARGIGWRVGLQSRERERPKTKKKENLLHLLNLYTGCRC